MTGDRARAVLAVSGPAVVLAAAGLTHPVDLTDATAVRWEWLHVVLLPVFPLLALGPWVVTRRARPRWAWAAAVLGYVYAAFYTALDVLAGIGAGALQRAGAAERTSVAFAVGNDLSAVGVWAHLLAAVLAVVAAARRAGRAALPGAVLVLLGAWLFLDNHIYWPVGGLSVLALGAGWAALVAVLPDAPAGVPTAPGPAVGAASG